MGYAFISYSSKNQSAADSMRELLKKNSIETWMAPYDIPIGSRYGQVINQAIKECACFVLLLTEHSQNSIWVPKEVERALNYGKPIIPIQLEQIKLNDEFELYISTNQIVAIQKIDESEPLMEKILATVLNLCGTTNGAVSSSQSGEKTASKKQTDTKRKPSAPVTVAERLRATIKASASADAQSEGAERLGRNLAEALQAFKIDATVDDYDIGPRLIRYYVTPARGVSATKISRLKDDLKLALQTESLRIEIPIPGTNKIGIELPRRNPKWVRLLDVMKNDEIARSTTTVALGSAIDGELIYKDAKDFPHLIVAGAVGMGKSVFINSLVISILAHATPDEIRFILIDPRRIEFNNYHQLPHLLCPVVNDTKGAINALKYAENEMTRRYERMTLAKVRSIDAYNEYAKDNGLKQLPRIFIIIDELAELMLVDKKTIEGYVLTIAQKARLAGIHLILGTARPSVDVLTGLIKANIPSRVTFKTACVVDSMTAIDKAGAEELLHNGDMLYVDMARSPIRLQSLTVTDTEVKSFIDTLKSVYENTVYDNDALKEIMRDEDENTVSSSLDAREEDSAGIYDIYVRGLLQDETFLKCVDALIENGTAAISWLQRKMLIGYSKAASYFDAMEHLGIIEKSKGAKPRAVLMTKEAWRSKLKELTDFN